MRIKCLAITAGVALVASISVNAAPISGSIDIVANLSEVNVDKTANTVTFIDNSIAIPGNALVSNASGDFVPFVLTTAAYANFTYDPLLVGNPLWTLTSGAASFDLTSITTIDEAGIGIVLTGAGVVHAVGYDDTPGVWSFSADTPAGANFTFSSRTVTVPDGGTTLMLLGGALSALGMIRRKLVA